MKKHLDIETLLEYLEDPSRIQFKDLRMHLLTCSDCRSRSTQLGVLTASLKKIPLFEPEILEQQTAASVAAWVDGHLSDEHKTEVGTLLANEPTLIKAALQYALNQRAYHMESQRNPQKPAISKQHPSNFLHRIKGLLNLEKSLGSRFNRQAQIWLTAAVTAGLTFAIALGVILASSKDRAIMLAAYQDDPMIYFSLPKQNIPGIGFFGSARSRQAAYSGLSIFRVRELYRFSWEEVAQAKDYTLDIYQITGKQMQKMTTNTLPETTLELDSSLFKPGLRYEWHLHGQLSNENSFTTKGGFVVPK